METTHTNTDTAPLDVEATARATTNRMLLATKDWLLRPSLTRGMFAWAALIGIAYLIGTMAIAPMIGEAAGLRPGVYALPSGAAAKKQFEPTVQITPVASVNVARKDAAPTAQKAGAEKPRRHRHKRHHRLPEDAVYLGQRRHHTEDADSPARHEESDPGAGEPHDNGGGDSGVSKPDGVDSDGQ